MHAFVYLVSVSAVSACSEITDTDGLLIVDTQNDFMAAYTPAADAPPPQYNVTPPVSAGSLAVAGTAEIIAPLNAWIDLFEGHGTVFASLDWHPRDWTRCRSRGHGRRASQRLMPPGRRRPRRRTAGWWRSSARCPRPLETPPSSPKVVSSPPGRGTQLGGGDTNGARQQLTVHRWLMSCVMRRTHRHHLLWVRPGAADVCRRGQPATLRRPGPAVRAPETGRGLFIVMRAAATKRYVYAHGVRACVLPVSRSNSGARRAANSPPPMAFRRRRRARGFRRHVPRLGGLQLGKQRQ